jgi:hypothetical protein
MIIRITLGLALVLGISQSAHAQITDDHGNDPSQATVLHGISNVVAGVFEYRADQDMFSFPVLPQWSYIVRVATATVWDVRVEVVPPLGSPRMQSTNTVPATSPATMTWTNPGTSGRWYLRVTPMFQFTTGSYHMAVWTVPAENDADADGIADAWELATFGSITNADATSYRLRPDVSDRASYLAGLGTNGILAIESWTGSAGQEVFTWPSAAHAQYAVDASPHLSGPWTMIGTRTAGSSDPVMSWTNHAAAVTTQFYRIRFVP